MPITVRKKTHYTVYLEEDQGQVVRYDGPLRDQLQEFLHQQVPANYVGVGGSNILIWLPEDKEGPEGIEEHIRILVENWFSANG